VTLQLGGWVRDRKLLTMKLAFYDISHSVSDLDGDFGTTQAIENEYLIWNM
jgi:hypothetical protein